MPQRLTALDASFLHLERAGAHMHVAAVCVFEGEPPAYDELLRTIERRLHLVPRYRQRLAEVPLGQGRPVWVDDPHFNLRYHVRHAGLPSPGGEEQLKALAGRVFAQPLDRSKPLWDLLLVEGLDDGRFAILSKTHHALVDGVSGVDLMSLIFDAAEEGTPIDAPAEPWQPRPTPSDVELLVDALRERATVPAEAARAVRALTRAPRNMARRAAGTLGGVTSLALSGLNSPAPRTSLNVPIGPHRRYTWVDADLPEFKAIKDGLGGTINDVVLSAVSLALGDFLRGRGEDTTDLELKAMVPVSVRADSQRGALGNRVATMWAPLPVGEEDPVAVFERVHDAMDGLKSSGQAVGAEALTQLADFAPPTILSQAARLQSRQRFFNLVVTNVPGPQFPLFCCGRRLVGLYPVVPLARRQALGVAIMSYDGRLGFGLLGDYDALPDLEELAGALQRAIGSLAAAAGLPPSSGVRPARRARSSAAGPGLSAVPEAGAEG